MIRWFVFIGLLEYFSAITNLIGYIFDINFYKIGEFLGSSKPLATMTIIGWVTYCYFIYWLAGYLLKNKAIIPSHTKSVCNFGIGEVSYE